MTVAECKAKSIDNFSKHLCGYHMPLTVVVKYSPNAIQSEGSEQESMSREELEAEIAKLKRKIREMTVELLHKACTGGRGMHPLIVCRLDLCMVTCRRCPT